MIQFRIYFQGESLKWPTEFIELIADNVFDAYNTLTNSQKSQVEFVTSENDVFSKHYLEHPEDFIVEELPF